MTTDLEGFPWASLLLLTLERIAIAALLYFFIVVCLSTSGALVHRYVDYVAIETSLATPILLRRASPAEHRQFELFQSYNPIVTHYEEGIWGGAMSRRAYLKWQALGLSVLPLYQAEAVYHAQE